MKKMVNKVVGAVVLALIIGAISTAPEADAQPCAWFGPNPSNAICGTPNLGASYQNGLNNLKANLNPQTALNNLKHNLGLG